MKVVQKYDVGKPVEILQPILELREKLHRSSDASCSRRLNRHSFQFLKGTVDDANGTVLDSHSVVYRKCV